MKRKNNLLLLSIVVALLNLTVSSCKSGPSDTELSTSVSTALKANPDLGGITVSVKDGVVTLGGECKDEATKSQCEELAKAVKGVKQVLNNCTVTPPPPPPAPVEISADETLKNSVQDAIKDNSGVKAEVKDGVITLTGEIKRSDLPKLLQKLNALKPKKIENKLTIK